MVTHNDIPDTVKTYSGPSAWRIADGKLRRGREVDGNLEERTQVTGNLLRVGVHEGVTDDGQTYEKIECDLETANGIVSIGANTSSVTSSITFAQGLLECAKGELICIEPNKAKKANSRGTYSTYSNVFHVDRQTLKATQTKRWERTDETSDEQLESLKAQLRKHPAYAPRPNLSSEASEKDLFWAEVHPKGWPALDPAEKEYCELASKALSRSIESYSQMSDDDWNELRLAASKLNAVPKILKPALDRAAAAPVEDDPFA